MHSSKGLIHQNIPGSDPGPHHLVTGHYLSHDVKWKSCVLDSALVSSTCQTACICVTFMKLNWLSSWPKMKVAFIQMLVMVHLELFPCQVFTIIVYNTACIRMNLIMNITTQLLPDFWISGSLWFSRLYSFLFCILNSSLSPSVTIA